MENYFSVAKFHSVPTEDFSNKDPLLRTEENKSFVGDDRRLPFGFVVELVVATPEIDECRQGDHYRLLCRSPSEPRGVLYSTRRTGEGDGEARSAMTLRYCCRLAERKRGVPPSHAVASVAGEGDDAESRGRRAHRRQLLLRRRRKKKLVAFLPAEATPKLPSTKEMERRSEKPLSPPELAKGSNGEDDVVGLLARRSPFQRHCPVPSRRSEEADASWSSRLALRR
nr:hypothetical protein Iba_chr09fCG10850 [Ipomoea batatas]